MYKGSIEPLYVVVLGEGEQDLTANDGEGEQQDCSPRHSQGEGTQVQPTGGARETSCYIIVLCSQTEGTQLQPTVGTSYSTLYT